MRDNGGAGDGGGVLTFVVVRRGFEGWERENVGRLQECAAQDCGGYCWCLMCARQYRACA